ncbi:MAG: alkaline phosphatase family protein [Chloroflexota bacterium]|nr:alkaline phosphatase family protein [Anaerolineae bacterium]
MPDALASSLERRILERKLLEIETPWASEIVFPYYDGLSIRNLAHTVVRLLDGRPSGGWLGSAPLDGALWEPYWGRVKRVVLFISDGLGWRLLQELIAGDPALAQTVADLTAGGMLVPLTSVAPSTTAAALPAIWTGSSPIATGLVGTQLFLREFGTLASMLHYRPVCGRHRADVLEEWGLDFGALLPLKTLGEALAERRIPSHLLLQKDLLGSGLSRVMHRGVQHVVRHIGYTDLWINLRELLRETRRERCFINVYWSAVDAVAHLYGAATEQALAEIGRQLADLRAVLDAGGVADGRTLFALVADHGHSPITDYVSIQDHPPLAEALRCGPGGETRFRYLYLREGYRAGVIDYLRQTMPDRFAAVRPEEAQAAGLFGPDPPHREAGARLGDLAVIAREGAGLSEKRQGPLASASRHGGLSEREMLVPLLMRLL